MGKSKEYAYTSGYSSLRVHLEIGHRVEYLRLCKENGWKNQLPSVKLDASLAASQSQDPSGQGLRPRQPFSKDAFMRHLIAFIVADDQVGCAAVSVSPLPYIISVYQCDRVP